jgi:hypothetical protein
MADPTCFVIMPIGPRGSRIRKRSTRLFETVIAPAARDAGYAPVRADQLPGAGMVMTQIVHHLANDPLVIADLTGANPNVYYELALRHAMRKPVLGTIHTGEALPFDISALRVVEFDTQDDHGMDQAREALTGLIRRVDCAGEGRVSPVSVALPAWTLSTPAGRIPQELLEAIIGAFVELRFRLVSPTMSPEPCVRCHQADYVAQEVGHMLDRLADLLGIFGPAELRDVIWRRLAIVTGSHQPEGAHPGDEGCGAAWNGD